MPQLPKQKSFTALKKDVDVFNSIFSIGELVKLDHDSGEPVLTRIKHPAEVLQGHSAVVWLEDISGCYAIEKVSKISS